MIPHIIDQRSIDIRLPFTDTTQSVHEMVSNYALTDKDHTGIRTSLSKMK